MRKLSLLLTMMLVTSLGGVTQAKTYQLGKSLTLEEALTKSEVALVFRASATGTDKIIYYDTVNEFTMTDNTKTHFALGDAATVLNTSTDQCRFKIVADMTYNNSTAYSVQFVDDSKYFTVEWNGESKADSKDNRPFVIKATDGTTNGYEFRCYRTDDSNNDRTITFAANGGTDTWYTPGIIYMYEIEEVSDKIITEPADDASLFPLTEGALNTTIWGNNNSYDASTKTITIGADGNAVGWTFDKATDLSSYSKLVIELQETLDFGPSLRFRNATVKSSGKDVHYIGLESGKTTYEVDLTASDFTYDESEGAKVALDLTDINAVYFWAWAGEKEIKLNKVYLVSAKGEVTYLIRSNTAADTYGTISLPYAAAKPENATVYDVVGYDDSNVYLKEVEALEAGKAYVFKSTDGNDITFTKTGDSENLTSPATGNALTGYFDAEDRSVPAESYILYGGQWLRVTADGNNTVGKYRAYLTLSEDLKVASAPAKAVVMTLDGNETTGINSVNAADDDAPVYNLSGMRVKNPTRGIYVKNGKKYIVK